MYLAKNNRIMLFSSKFDILSTFPVKIRNWDLKIYPQTKFGLDPIKMGGGGELEFLGVTTHKNEDHVTQT